MTNLSFFVSENACIWNWVNNSVIIKVQRNFRLKNAILWRVRDQSIAAGTDGIGKLWAHDVRVQQEWGLLTLQGMESSASYPQSPAGSQAHVWSSFLSQILNRQNGSHQVSSSLVFTYCFTFNQLFILFCQLTSFDLWVCPLNTIIMIIDA